MRARRPPRGRPKRPSRSERARRPAQLVRRAERNIRIALPSRAREPERVVATFRQAMQIKLIHVEASARFLRTLAEVTNPETKRVRVGEGGRQIAGRAARPCVDRPARHAAEQLQRAGREVVGYDDVHQAKYNRQPRSGFAHQPGANRWRARSGAARSRGVAIFSTRLSTETVDSTGRSRGGLP